MATSPQKRKFPDVSPEESEKRSTSRSGRVVKPKVFYDPSVNAKRRSLPNIETAKPKKAAKSIEQQAVESQVKKLEKSPSQEKSKNPPVKAAMINNRRRTICAQNVIIADDGTGCIVCSRSDIKKGRFVNCTDCKKRGHFTCLRNEKLFKTADQEHNWQCPACKVCKHCLKLTPSEQLYKCILCLSSCHLQCSSKFAPLPKSVVKKKFTCGMCSKGLSASKNPLRSFILNRKSEGFPGLPRHDTAKVDPKPTVTTNKLISIPTDSNLKTHASKNPLRSFILNRKSQGFPGFPRHDTAKVDPKPADTTNKLISIPTDSNSKTHALSKTVDRKTDDLEVNSFEIELEIKREKSTPTPEQPETSDTESLSQIQLIPLSTIDDTKKISVRMDLVQPKTVESEAVQHQESDDEKMDNEYDTKTIIKPHESIPDVRKWDCDEVYTYFTAKAPQFSQLLRENQIDGDALLLIKREDVLNRFNLKLGPALRLYTHIVELQYKNNNPILAWNEF